MNLKQVYTLAFLNLILITTAKAQENSQNQINNILDSYNEEATVRIITDTPELKIDYQKIQQLQKNKAKLDLQGEFSNQYNIQLYYGELEKANAILDKAKNKFPEYYATIKWETPNYKVWVGSFRTRLKADRALIRIQQTFENAFIFKPVKK